MVIVGLNGQKDDYMGFVKVLYEGVVLNDCLANSCPLFSVLATGVGQYECQSGQ